MIIIIVSIGLFLYMYFSKYIHVIVPNHSKLFELFENKKRFWVISPSSILRHCMFLDPERIRVMTSVLLELQSRSEHVTPDVEGCLYVNWDTEAWADPPLPHRAEPAADVVLTLRWCGAWRSRDSRSAWAPDVPSYPIEAWSWGESLLWVEEVSGGRRGGGGRCVAAAADGGNQKER